MNNNNKQYAKVTWSHAETLPDGHVCSISDKSGILKIVYPNSFLSTMVYFDQFQGLGITNEHLVAYVNRYAEVIKNSQDNKQAKKLDSAKQKLIQSIVNNPALTDEQKQSMIKLVA